jgi:hypothetical protein
LYKEFDSSKDDFLNELHAFPPSVTLIISKKKKFNQQNSIRVSLLDIAFLFESC